MAMKAEAVPAAPPSEWHSCARCPHRFDAVGLPVYPAVIKVKGKGRSRWVWLCWSHSVMALGEPVALTVRAAVAVVA